VRSPIKYSISYIKSERHQERGHKSITTSSSVRISVTSITSPQNNVSEQNRKYPRIIIISLQQDHNTTPRLITIIIDIPTRNKLGDFLQCNRYIHLVKSDAQFDEQIRVPNRNSRTKTTPKIRTRKQY
jgi:hypothetical protein